MGLFDPHPDYPFATWAELSVEGSQLGFALADYGLSLGAWSITIKQIAAGGGEAVAVLKDAGAAPAAWIRVPRLGVIRTLPAAGQSELPAGPVFSLRHYDDGAPLIDPFAEIRALIAAPRVAIAAPKKPRQPPRGPPSRVSYSWLRWRSLPFAIASPALPPILPAAKSGPAPAAPSPDRPPNVPSEPGPPSTSDPRVTLTPVYTLPHPTRYGQLKVAFSPDGGLLASGDVTQDTIKLWDMTSRTELRTIDLGNKPFLHFVAFSSDNRLLVTGDQAGQGLGCVHGGGSRENRSSFICNDARPWRSIHCGCVARMQR